MEHIRSAFDAVAEEYDCQRKWVIPELEEFYRAAVWAADWKGQCPAILDVGAGTGLLSAMMIERYPDARLTLLDIADVRYISGDYTTTDFGGSYDIVCSALSIHHLEDEDKRRLYKRIFLALNPGGVFVNADQVAGDTEAITKRNLEYWDGFLAKSPLSEDERNEIRRRRGTLDRNARLSPQLEWLHEAGFSHIDLVYKNRTFVVLTGRKP
jgi:tRNA (cmo5U34)-methyltransferase